MNQLAMLYLAAILAGFALIIVPGLAATFITSAALATLFIAVGAIAVIVFGLALLYLAVRALLKNFS
ncbi:hypothetical protein QGM71_18365 [Virgibacillus sp. C22-A2]|uniref:DUF4175 domain-containing protein n=1 Tax=Virgibacillus tibetensis TaxID=3042313 RepID=A0ABU6KJZ1_9BACI|nr:hypothetical protein [Virgibacillus sp. C22-A2]